MTWCLALLALHPGSAVAETVVQSGTPALVETQSGIVQGKTQGVVKTFLGIPYAQAPLGALRWKPPLSPVAWQGVRQATQFGAHCMQPPLYADMIFRDAGNSEDCLTLNVWTLAADKTAKLPVMVWIHGGGFATGGTSEPRQDGAALAQRGVVVVSMNYRLGIFGFFAHPDLIAESGRHAAGNYGLLDQVAALQWIQQNIATFGGDPTKVTIFGESAGASSVSALMASPLAKGLFTQAIGESSGAFFNHDRAFRSLSERSARDAEIARTMLSVSTVAQLRAVPAQQLLDVEAQEWPETRFVPDVDGYFLPESIAAIFAAKRQNDVPLIAGWNRDEKGIVEKATTAGFTAQAQTEFGARANAFLTLYPADNPAEAVRSASDFAADSFIAFSTWQWLEAQATTGTHPVYRYRFDLPPPSDPYHPERGAAYHSAEIPYVFGNLALLDGFAWRPQDQALSAQMQQYWTNFAKTGNPNGEGLPAWPVYQRDSTADVVMHFGAESRGEPDRTRERYLFLNSIWANEGPVTK